MDVLVAAFDPGKHTKWDVETTRRHNCTSAAWTLVAGYVICSWSNTTGVDDGNNLSRNVAVPYLIYYCFYVQLLFTTVFHDLCISRQKPFFLFNSLPNALFIITFLDVSGGICQISISICFFVLLYMSRSLQDIRYTSLWFWGAVYDYSHMLSWRSV